MNITSPRISPQLIRIDDFLSCVQDFLAEELPICEIDSREERIEGAELVKIEIRNSIFKNCTFHICDFEKSSFIDVIFQACDFSNSKFQEAYFERCQFVSCKCIGIDMSHTVVKNTVFEKSNLQYAYFNKTKITDVLFDHIDFTEASIIESKLKRFAVMNSKFINTNFFKTMLENVDFSNSELVTPLVSMPPAELKGSIINMFQAANLIGLWGIRVKP